MAAPAKRTPGGGAAILLPVALLLGLAAAILLAPAPTPGGFTVLPEVTAPAAPWWLGPALIVAFVVVWAVVLGVRRAIVGGGMPLDLLISLLAIGGIAVVFDAIFHVLPSSAPISGNATRNQTVPPPLNGSCTPPANCSIHFPGSPIPTVAPWYEGAALYGILIAAVVAAALLYPRLEAVFTSRTPPPPGAPEEEGTRELREALGRLAKGGPDDDARIRMIRVYGQLLDRVAGALERLGPATPREIAEELVRRFSVSPPTAREITELFEEARYSSGRPMSEDAVRRAEAALRRAIEESSRERGRP